MSKYDKLLLQILRGSSDANIPFDDLCQLLRRQVFVAEVPELPGCMAHGDAQQAALINANEAIRLWIETAEEFGDPVPEPKGQRLMLAWKPIEKSA
jgi:predicted RNase H-like HicB family nuclease